MKKIIFLFSIVLVLFSVNSKAQTASDYFPVNDPGHIWNYKITTLDTLGNPVESSIYFERDSLTGSGNYYDKNAYLVISKSGTAATLPFQPYTDSSFVNLDNNLANIYFGNVLGQYVGGFLETGNNYAGWYPVYDFTAAPLQTVELFRVDTTITIDSTTIPARLTIERRRLQDELIQTELGLFTAKKFEISFNVYYIAIIPLKIISIPTNFWLAENNWLVKERRESVWISYPDLGIPPIFVPGSEKIIVQDITSVENGNGIPNTFSLDQNYPNPFNPTTTINYSIPSVKTGHTLSLRLIVYNALGQKVATLVNKKQAPGNYSIRFDASKLSSGIYFYTLQAGGFTATKKMILMK